MKRQLTAKEYALQSAVVDKILEKFGLDLAMFANHYALIIEKEHKLKLPAELIFKACVCATAQLFEDGRIVIKETK